MNDINWIYNLKKDIPVFLSSLKGKKRKGFYHYSLSGDYFGENIKWGLGNSVFFLKIIYTLDLKNEFKEEVDEAMDFVKSFQRKDGRIYDSFLHLVSIPFIIRKIAINKSFDGAQTKQTKRAETRQSFSALMLFDEKLEYDYDNIPKTKKDIDRYLEKLNWNMPWGAGSHFSHLLFFLDQSRLENKEQLINYAISWVNKIQHGEDGFWYNGNPDITQKINGAMKIITGLKAVNKVEFKYFEQIIDTCLKVRNDRHACDNFNITYVLKYCFEMSSGAYRSDEIRDFMLTRLDLYKNYYHFSKKGFSFKKNKANRFYYNALVSRGKNEPDIHGVVMFLWGISVIAQVLGVDKELGFKEFIT